MADAVVIFTDYPDDYNAGEELTRSTDSRILVVRIDEPIRDVSASSSVDQEYRIHVPNSETRSAIEIALRDNEIAYTDDLDALYVQLDS